MSTASAAVTGAHRARSGGLGEARFSAAPTTLTPHTARRSIVCPRVLRGRCVATATVTAPHTTAAPADAARRP